MDEVAILPLEPTNLTPAPPAAVTFRDVPWRWWDPIVGLTPLVVPGLVAKLIDPAVFAGLPRWTWIVGTVLELTWSLSYPLAVARWRAGAIRLPRVRTILVEGLLALLLMPVLFGAVMLFNLFGQRLGWGGAGSTTPFDTIARSPDRYETIALAVLAIALAPVAEEIFFRGMLLNTFRRRLPLVLAVLIQGAIFGLLHPFNLLGMATVALGGCLLGLIAAWRQTLVTPLFLHAGQNLVGMLMITTAAAAYNAAATLGVVATPQEGGQVITQLQPGSAAEEAGLQLGDAITAIDGAEFPAGGLAEVIQSHQVGDQVTVQFRRLGEAKEARATLKQRQEPR